MGSLILVFGVAVWLGGVYLLWRRRGAEIRGGVSAAANVLPPVVRSWLGRHGWALPLIVLAMISAPSGTFWAWEVLGAVLLVLFVPGPTTRMTPWALIGYGCIGYWTAIFHAVGDTRYGIVPIESVVGPPPGYQMMVSYSYWLVPEAALFIAAGAWLLPRVDAPGYGLIKSLIGRPRGGAGGQLAPLLLPVLLVLLELFWTTRWLGPYGRFNRPIVLAVAVAILIAGFIVVLRRPRLAAMAALAGIVFLGAYGILLALFWPGVTGGFYGAMLVNSRLAAITGGLLEGGALLALAGWLAPRIYRSTPDPELAAKAKQLTERVQTLTRTRTDAVDTAAAELRRIERDLHDGAQARLVALGISLQAAERLFLSSPDAALALVSEAKEASSRALTELRDLVRGIYPPVLADRGLADAVRALALDTPLHTIADIDLPGEVEMPVGSAVYFSIAEVLTNAAKHSGARTVRIHISHGAGVLRAQVTDDGVGGADPEQGTGLLGVERRLATFDGILAVSSPPGGPTIIAIEVPCELSLPKTSSC